MSACVVLGSRIWKVEFLSSYFFLGLCFSKSQGLPSQSKQSQFPLIQKTSNKSDVSQVWLPGFLWFEVWLPHPFPLSRAVTSDKTRSDISTLKNHYPLSPPWVLPPAGLWSRSQVQQPDFADSSSVFRQSQDHSELPEDQILKQDMVFFSEEPQGWLKGKHRGRVNQWMVLLCHPLVAPSHGLIMPLWLGTCLGFSSPEAPWAPSEFRKEVLWCSRWRRRGMGCPWVLNQRNGRGGEVPSSPGCWSHSWF